MASRPGPAGQAPRIPGEERVAVAPSTIRFRTSLRNTVLDVMRSRGWKETDSETEWDFHWADVCWIREVMDHVRLEEHQRCNHYRNHYELTRKDLTVKNLKRLRKALVQENKLEEAVKLDFFPVTFSLPADYSLFETEYRKNPNSVWIMKPPAKAQGKGIFLFTKISQISEWKKDLKYGSAKDREQAGKDLPEAYLAQRYLDNPHLVGGKKYDLRIYALVVSYSPLVVYLYRSGFARFCHHRFTMKDVDNTFIHVTNVAVQKMNPKYTAQSGCKWGIRNLREFFMSTVGEAATNKVFGDIQTLILKTLHSVEKIMMQDKHCFELYGYDVLIDDTLRPWLIEVNASPSLTAETPADYHLKFNLLEDMFNIVDMEKKRQGNDDRIGGFDLIWRKGPAGVTANDTTGIKSYLGCNNEFAIPMSKIKLPPKMAKQGSERSII
jgi:tubulin polyglutamylase TTLL9